MRRTSNKSSAVRQQRAAKVQVADSPQMAIFRAIDYYPSPPWAARAGAEVLRDLDPQSRSIWEPACGEGHMAEPLKEFFPAVFASDIHNHGYGQVMDFLMLKESPVEADWIFTNPPFNLAVEFLRQGLRFARRGVVLLARIAFLEGRERYGDLYLGENRLTLCCPFIERVPMQLDSWDPDLSSAACYALFFFQKGAAPLPIRPIPPGTMARLHRPADIRRFAKLAPAPLLDAVNE